MAGPGFVPKAALTTSRIVHKPFEVPMKMTQSSLLVGGAVHNTVGKTNAAIAESYAALQPKGPAKLPLAVAKKVDASVGKSAGMADRNTNVFWKPLSEGSESIGMAVSGPGAYYYAKKAGFPEPSNPDLLKALVHSKGYPTPPPPKQEGGGGGGGQAQGPQPSGGEQGGTPSSAAPPAAAQGSAPPADAPQAAAAPAAAAPADAPPAAAAAAPQGAPPAA